MAKMPETAKVHPVSNKRACFYASCGVVNVTIAALCATVAVLQHGYAAAASSQSQQHRHCWQQW